MNLRFYIIYLITSICFISCTNDLSGITIELGNGDSIRVPLGYIHKPMLSDSYAGEIFSPNKDVYLMYDIGSTAGYYVKPNSSIKTIDYSVNEIFWYEKVDKQYLADPDCCVFITFPNCGPANFITLNDDNFQQVLDIIRTYTSN